MRSLAFPNVAPPSRALHLGLPLATLAVSAAAVCGGDAGSPLAILYVGIAACAFCFLNRFEAAIHASIVAVAYAATLSLLPAHNAHGALLRYAIFAVCLFAAAAVLDALRAKHHDLSERMRDLSLTDAGTGLSDRVRTESMLAIEAERAGRSGIRFAVVTIAMDADEIDSLDDAGTERAARVGKAVAHSIRSIDFAGRLAPNLFCVLAIYTDERGAETLVERVRALVVEASEPGRPPALSFGISIYGRHGIEAGDLLKASRAALDAARQHGGERSIVAPGRMAVGDEALRNPEIRIAARSV